jgi:hypothetical protein
MKSHKHDLFSTILNSMYFTMAARFVGWPQGALAQRGIIEVTVEVSMVSTAAHLSIDPLPIGR